jgi:transcriptional regulator with XRE-family HTH domain
METIGQRLRRLRTDRGLSQRELSSPGVSYAYISRIEAGTRTPSVKALRMLAAKLGVPEEYLEYGEQPVDNTYVESELRRLQRLLPGADDGAEQGAAGGEAQGMIAALLEYMTSAETRAMVVERLAEEERKRQEFEQLRSRFASDEQMRDALGDQLADQVVERLGERAAALRR